MATDVVEILRRAQRGVATHVSACLTDADALTAALLASLPPHGAEAVFFSRAHAAAVVAHRDALALDAVDLSTLLIAFATRPPNPATARLAVALHAPLLRVESALRLTLSEPSAGARWRSNPTVRVAVALSFLREEPPAAADMEAFFGSFVLADTRRLESLHAALLEADVSPLDFCAAVGCVVDACVV
jgi:hypothetical protein